MTLRSCPVPRCPALTKGGPCFAHRQVRERARGTARERGYDARWDKYSRAFLRDHPLCVDCDKEGRVTGSAVTDHIEPHRGDMALFWDPKNHQALCKAHHDRKTATQDGGFGRVIAHRSTRDARDEGGGSKSLERSRLRTFGAKENCPYGIGGRSR